MEKDFGSVRLNALRIMLKPIVQFALRGSNSIQEFIEVLKFVFVEVAHEEISALDEDVTVSRLTMMTGLHRIEVNRIYKNAESDKKTTDLNLLIRIIGHWERSKRFLTAKGTPRVLSYGTPDSDFTKLTKAVSKCIIPTTALFELERVGAIEKTPRGLKLVKNEVITVDDPGMYEMVALGVASLLTSAEENIENKQRRSRNKKSPNLYLVTEYDNIYEDDIDDIRDWILNKGNEFHKSVRARISKSDKDLTAKKGKKQAGGRVVVGSYSFTSKPS